MEVILEKIEGWRGLLPVENFLTLMPRPGLDTTVLKKVPPFCTAKGKPVLVGLLGCSLIGDFPYRHVGQSGLGGPQA